MAGRKCRSCACFPRCRNQTARITGTTGRLQALLCAPAAAPTAPRLAAGSTLPGSLEAGLGGSDVPLFDEELPELIPWGSAEDDRDNETLPLAKTPSPRMPLPPTAAQLTRTAWRRRRTKPTAIQPQGGCGSARGSSRLRWAHTRRGARPGSQSAGVPANPGRSAA
jgi:hypothetical protein